MGDDDPEYAWTGESVTHVASKTSVVVKGSDARRAFGLGAHARIVICDEPGAWQLRGGELMWQALRTSLGKREMTIIFVGTMAPAPARGPGSWWPRMVLRGSCAGRHVKVLQGDPKAWESWPAIRRANPALGVNPLMKIELERELRAAREDPAERRAWIQFRLNVVRGQTVSQQLVTDDEWDRVVNRLLPPGEPAGRPAVGIDMGTGRSWCAAVGVWPDGRVDCRLVAPGVPSLQEREHDDGVPDGTYLDLAQSGALVVADGKGSW